MEVIDFRKYFHNINDALENYRGLTAFCESALDGIIWHINGIDIPTKLLCNTESKLTTFDIKVHIDRELEQYQAVCMLRNEEQKYNIIRFKYIDMPGKGVKNEPFTNEQLADRFGCSVATIYRQLTDAKKELKIYLFGVDRINISPG